MADKHAHVASTPATVRWGRLPGAGAEPVAVIEDGGTVVFDTVSHEGILADQGSDPVAFFGALGVPRAEVLDDAIELTNAGLPHDPSADGPHIVTGPVAVVGAQPGDVLQVEFVGLRLRARYGIISNRHGRGALAGRLPRPNLDGTPTAVVSHLATVGPDGRTGHLSGTNGGKAHFPLCPFLGLVGVAGAGETEPSSRPPGPHGGNLDIRHLGVGTSLFLPVRATGALLYVGDPHYAQGNGEVALTAFEAPLQAVLRVSVARGASLPAVLGPLGVPWGETDEHIVAIGLGEDLDEALRQAVAHALVIVSTMTGLDEATALSYLSAAADFEISQAVNGTRGVHCMLRKADLH